MPDHVLLDGHGVVDLPVVHLERQAHEAGQDRRGPGLRADGRGVLPLLGTDERQAIWIVSSLCVADQ